MPTQTKSKNGGSGAQPTTTPATAGGDGGAPVLTPEMLVTTPPAEAAGGGGVPGLQPPGSEAAGLGAHALAEGMTATTTAKVGGLWTNNAQSNAWAYLNGVGWRRLGPANAGAHHALLALARLARDGGMNVQCEDDGSVIHTMYLW